MLLPGPMPLQRKNQPNDLLDEFPVCGGSVRQIRIAPNGAFFGPYAWTCQEKETQECRLRVRRIEQGPGVKELICLSERGGLPLS